ncbi:MAG: monooxygenase, partial [Bradyrhizobium sp.]
SGPSPRFALFAAASAEADRIAKRFPALLEPALRPPLQQDGSWLARPDGYAACAAKVGDEAVIERYLAEQV